MILVFPDLHLARNTDEIDALIERLAPSQTVFLGDYFDQFDAKVEDYRRMAMWLLASLSRPNRTYLIGNHELHYICPQTGKGFGYNALAYPEVNRILTFPIWRHRFKFAHGVGPWLFTHAGLQLQTARWSQVWKPDLAYGIASLADHINYKVWRATASAINHRGASLVTGERITNWAWRPGVARGGHSTRPGILWCDYSEFYPIPHVCQVFGHTYTGSLARRKLGTDSVNYCFDTSANYLCYHAMLVHPDRAEVPPVFYDVRSQCELHPAPGDVKP